MIVSIVSMCTYVQPCMCYELLGDVVFTTRPNTHITELGDKWGIGAESEKKNNFFSKSMGC